ncbi:rhodanese-like domain-containing protein [Mycolicibacterium mageritense]|uniref:rhodanese-like domain-containing protein n=1 Tax=Mycolicibacterium mageritense TaxID=53462 RepID=UPI001E492B5F|nr:rhodanese-like domain-containing protein [Mycolicibacterium mageritense]MCC9184787.1 rhodanese-like domain-containing protein [Mycolicibacterium mageritense]
MRSPSVPSMLMYLAGVVFVAVSGCASTGESASTPSAPASASTSAGVPQARSVGPQQFADSIAEPARVTINVHVPYEGDIPGTDLSIPFDQIEARAGELPQRTTPVAVYCRSGRMSLIAANTLSAMGYRDVVELAGGTMAWEASARSLTWR